MKRVTGIACVLLFACTGSPEPPSPGNEDQVATGQVWPSPPAQPRIRLEYVFDSPEDIGIRPSGISKLWEALVGAKETGMVRPYSVAVTEGKIAVGDPGAHAVHLFDRNRGTYRFINSAGDAVMQSCVGIALGKDQIFVSDSSEGRVHVFDGDGDFSFTLDGLQRPTGLAFDQERQLLFVAETLAHRIVTFDSKGGRLSEFGRRGVADGEFNYPSHISLRNGRLLVNDNMNFRIQAFHLDGGHLFTFGQHGDGSGFFSQPKGVAEDELGHIYVAGATIDRVQIFSAEGDFLLAVGGEGSRPGQFVMPTGVAIQGKTIYVADSFNRRIQVFSYIGDD